MRPIQISVVGTSYKGGAEPPPPPPPGPGDNGPGYSMLAGSANWASAGYGNYLSVPNGGDWAMGTGDFTVEWWQWTRNTTNNNRVWTVGQDTNASIGVSFENGASLYIWISGLVLGPITLNNWQRQWSHLALVRASGTLTFYQNGTSIGTVENTTDIANTTTPLSIGADYLQNSIAFDGHITDFHWIKGIAKYTANFTPPLSPIQPIPGTLNGTHPAAKNNSNQAWLYLGDTPDAIYIPVGASVTGSTWVGTETVTAVSTTASPGYVRLTLTGTRTYPAGTTYTFSWTSQTKLLLSNVSSGTWLVDSSAQNKTVTLNGTVAYSQRGPYLEPALWLDSTNVNSYSGSGLNWLDLGKSGNDATLAGSFNFGNGIITFLSSGQGRATGDSLSSLTTFTAAAWVKFTTVPGAGVSPCLITETYGLGPINYTIGLPTENGTIRGGFWDGGWRTAGGTTPTAATWYHFAITYDGSNLKWYVNGTLSDTVAYVGTPSSSNLGYRVAHRWDSSQYINGAVPVVQIFDRALSATEVSTVYSSHSFS